ncbi:MAG: hypothetical protein QME45_02025 [Clostridiales bacterium]|nr:hypothetical protein [Clostridiales bacterium]HBM81326.1 hypothetical protein [Clostridiaceae bacterium]
MLQLELLWKLQCIDKEINNFRKELKDRDIFEKLKELKEKYRIEIDAVNSRQKILQDNKSKAIRLNSQLKYEDEKLKECSSNLYRSGQNIKSIGGIQKEIQKHKFSIDKIENELLEIMDGNEKLEKDLNDRNGIISDYKNQLENLKETFVKKKSAIDKKIEQNNKLKNSLIKDIDRDYLNKYNEIACKKGSAVSQVTDGICMECGMKVNTILSDALKRKDAIYYCEYCGRILYLD